MYKQVTFQLYLVSVKVTNFTKYDGSARVSVCLLKREPSDPKDYQTLKVCCARISLYVDKAYKVRKVMVINKQ